MTSWKKLEREAAKYLGGKRRWRMGNYSERCGDIDHPRFSIECKYGKQVPGFIYRAIDQAIGYDNQKLPMAVLQKKFMEPLLVIRLQDLERFHEEKETLGNG